MLQQCHVVKYCLAHRRLVAGRIGVKDGMWSHISINNVSLPYIHDILLRWIDGFLPGKYYLGLRYAAVDGTYQH
jgi:hypothetical protein